MRIPALAALLLGLTPALAGCDGARQPAAQGRSGTGGATTARARPMPAGYHFPALSGRVVDGAGVIPATAKAGIAARLAALEGASRHQMVVVTVASLDGHDIGDYARLLGDYWGVGRAGVNDGVILLVAPREREIRLAVGAGLVRDLDDARSRQIVEGALVPALRRGDYAGGVTRAVEAVAGRINRRAEDMI